MSNTFNRVAGLLPGLVGIGLGQQPNGVAADIAAGLRGAQARRRGEIPADGAGVSSPSAVGALVSDDPDSVRVGVGRSGRPLSEQRA